MNVPPPAWIDGHPLMEAIAAAVYEHCTTGDGGTVHDDPRNIAAAAVTALRGRPRACARCRPLTSDDLKIIKGLARGHSTPRIADDLHTEPRAVRSRITSAATRLGIRHGLHPRLVDYAYRHGYLTTPAIEAPEVALTPMETEELADVVQGLSVPQTAADLGLSRHTVQNRRRALYVRLGAHTAAHAVALGWQLGLLGPASEAAAP